MSDFSGFPGGGGMQARLSASDARLYSTDRDIAHILKPLVLEFLPQRLQDMVLPELETMLGQAALTMDERGDALRVFLTFVTEGIINSNPLPQMADELERVGWFDPLRVRPEARVAIVAYLGTLFLGVAFQGIREATLNNVGPMSDSEELAKTAFETVDKVVAKANGMGPMNRASFVGLLRSYSSTKNIQLSEEEAEVVVRNYFSGETP